MGYSQLNCTEFTLVIYSNATQLSYRTPDHDQKGHMNNACLSFCSEVFMELALQFFSGTQHCVRGPCGIVYDRARFFYPQNGENISSLGFFECIGKFSQFLIFLISAVYNEACITVILVCLNIFHIWNKFWFLRYGPKCS